MQFIWDLRKSEDTWRRRGFDFAFASQVFAGFVVTNADIRRDYGELREIAIGLVEEFEITVVYTDRRNESNEIERRIISARRSSKKERKSYEKGAAKHG
jgi:uncharacterized protein